MCWLCSDIGGVGLHRLEIYITISYKGKQYTHTERAQMLYVGTSQ